MKIKRKGKVYPSPSSSASSSSSQPQPSPDVLSVLKLLPAVILALASPLSTEDKEVLAYMLTRSMTMTTTTTPNPSSLSHKGSKKKSTKQSPAAVACAADHRPPLFHCGCFECYTSYWFRWDSSPNRELIHKAIEAFEDPLTAGEKSKRIGGGGRGKKKDRLARRLVDMPSEAAPSQPQMPVAEVLVPEVVAETAPEDHAPTVRDGCGEEAKGEGDEGELPVEESRQKEGGLARKVLPDVLGLLNSRIWSLWSPTM